MNRLYRVLTIRKKIEAKRIEFNEVCTPAPKGQRITGMPRGGAARNVTEDYVERKEKLSAEIEALYSKLNRYWYIAEQLCIIVGCSEEEICLLKLRFYYNYTWKKVQQELQVHFSKKVWNKNRVFRVRRHAIEKINGRFTPTKRR